MSRIAGQMWDTIDAKGMSVLEANADNSYTVANAGDTAKWEAMSGPIIDKVLGEVSDKGIDAKAARDFIAAQMASY